MRWISKALVEASLDQDWRDAAEEARQELLAAPDETDRKRVIRIRTNVWRDYYESLPENLKHKCWYCEADDIRSDVPVDHFRPKNKVEEDEAHDGYWWLAFDWENYRCACTLCNSRRNYEDSQGGKGCRFPIRNPDQRATCPTDDLKAEMPDLLDPFDPDDHKLLWFDADGFPGASPNASEEQQVKVDNSVDIFHLHETKLVRARNEIRIEVERQVNNIRDGKDVQDSKLVLRNMVSETARLSRAAIVFLRAHRELPEVKDILDLD